MTEELKVLGAPVGGVGVTVVEVRMRRATLDAIPIAPLLAAPLAVRNARAEDAAELATLLGRALEGEIWDEGGVDREVLSDATVKRTLVVCSGARLLATASFQMREDTPGSGWVRWVGTDPERRREGLARALVIGVLGLAARAGCRDVRLSTRTDRLAAIRLYTELGFEPLLRTIWSAALGRV
jgi:mycothiol synthase